MEEEVNQAQEINEEQGPVADLFSGEDKDSWVTLEYLANVPLKIIVELGQTDIKLGELLRLQKGSTIELNKLAGEPLEFILGDQLAARGEVVVINEKFGIRLTDVINPEGEERKIEG